MTWLVFNEIDSGRFVHGRRPRRPENDERRYELTITSCLDAIKSVPSMGSLSIAHASDPIQNVATRPPRRRGGGTTPIYYTSTRGSAYAKNVSIARRRCSVRLWNIVMANRLVPSRFLALRTIIYWLLHELIRDVVYTNKVFALRVTLFKELDKTWTTILFDQSNTSSREQFYT